MDGVLNHFLVHQFQGVLEKSQVLVLKKIREIFSHKITLNLSIITCLNCFFTHTNACISNIKVKYENNMNKISTISISNMNDFVVVS